MMRSSVVALLCVLAACAASQALGFRNIKQFSGKVVMVTGGTSGIGFATVLGFARGGAKVVFCARDAHPTWYNGSSAEALINGDPEVKAAGGVAKFVKADVRDMAQVQNVLDVAVKTFGPLDIAVNNAGVSGPGMEKIHQMDKYVGGEHDPILTNLEGCVKSVIAETKYWVENKRNGIIVNTASIFGVRGEPTLALYSAAKHGVVGLTKSVALEYIKGTPIIRCNAIAPGMTNTPMVRNFAKVYDPLNPVQNWEGRLISESDPLFKLLEVAMDSKLPNGKMAEPVNQANGILFLASEEASYISGSILSIDDGLSSR